jgi:stress-induced morphogen
LLITHKKFNEATEVPKARTQLTRNRMFYALLKGDGAHQGAFHALQLTTRTPKEEEQAEQQNPELIRL